MGFGGHLAAKCEHISCGRHRTGCPKGHIEFLRGRAHEEIVRRLARAEKVSYVDPEYIPVQDATAVVNDIEVCVPLAGLIDFGKEAARLRKEIAQAQQEEALLTFKSTVLTAGQEVSDVLFGYNASMSKNDLRNKQIESLTKAVDFTQDLLMAGEANYTEVLTAEQSLLSAQLNRVNDKLEQLTYSVNLYKALGGGVK